MPDSTRRASPPVSPSLQWAARLLVLYAVLHAFWFVTSGIRWDQTLQPALVLAAFLGPPVLLPLLLAAALQRQAQWAWYATLLFAGWYAARQLLAVVLSFLMSGAPATQILLRVPAALAVCALCLAILALLIRPDARRACDVRAG